MDLGHSLSSSIVEYQTAVLHGDMDSAAEILPTLPEEQLNKVALFLEGRDLKELALQVTTDPDHKFDLSLQLNDLDTAVRIARSVSEPESETKWKAIGDRALMVWRFDLAREAFEKAGDLSTLMLLLLSMGDREGLHKLAATAEEKGAENLAFATLFQLGEAKLCVDLLLKTNRAPEAALFARTYAPSEVPNVVDVWRDELRTKNQGKIAGSVVHPSEHAELFEEGWEEALACEAGLCTNSRDVAKQTSFAVNRTT
ncbi:coatomer WD associated region-domain-containing protein [Suillus plorans]|uniref:Coatomer WD associated region-domain-containing protein n=1 Tax=Suillus plorans TaxID=116603 RepID=A0A9P7AB98_9AGAM|nr:coatomer WD associated region-domain-containing protein [Suillus plorans]KAG1785827.1 coatomer WD associated region-domain-containing protein [Suillus plorans]